jgi:hypothetical protein
MLASPEFRGDILWNKIGERELMVQQCEWTLAPSRIRWFQESFFSLLGAVICVIAMRKTLLCSIFVFGSINRVDVLSRLQFNVLRGPKIEPAKNQAD